MDRKWKSGAAVGAPDAADNASDGYPTAGNPGTGVPATKPGPYWYHMITEELLGIISYVGTALDKTVLTQVRDALFLLFDSQGIDPGGRLTISPGVAVSGDVAGAASHYYTPHRHNRIKLYDGVRWKWYTFAELSQAANDNAKSPAAVEANKNYDVFVWDDAGTVRATRGPKWNDGAVGGNDAARGTGANSTELEFFEGRWVNKNAITNGPAARRGLYVGSLRSDGASQFNDAAAARFVWNTYNRVKRVMQRIDPAGTWTYTTDTYRQANNNAANSLDFLLGLAEDIVSARVIGAAYNDSGNIAGTVGVGLDSGSANSAAVLCGNIPHAGIVPNPTAMIALYSGQPGIGRHFLAWLEKSTATGVTTWFGINSTNVITGITGEVMA